MKINIAIDGPSAAGKSTVADYLAGKLGYIHLDTGAMYRAVAWAALNKGLKLDDAESLLKLVKRMRLDMMKDGRILLDGHNITPDLRNNEVSMAASAVSKIAALRSAMVERQKEIAKDGGYILDGRDIGTVVLPNAELKIYLVADSEKRAQRRYKQDLSSGLKSDYNLILKDIIKRDYDDSHRAASPLTKADDAIEIDTTDMSFEEVGEKILALALNKIDRGEEND